VPVVHFRKEATPTPDQRTWRARIARNEKPLIAAFLAWVDRLHEQLTDNVLANAVIHRSAGMLDHILQAVAFQPVLYPVAVEEAERAFNDVAHLNPYLHLSFNLHNPNFDRMVQAEQARLVREVTTETRRAIANVVSRGYASGVHPYVLAPQIREVVGLTSRQANAVMNFAEGQRKLGRSPDRVAASAMRYAGKMRTARAKSIGRTETARAMVAAKQASWLDAGRQGLFNVATAEIRWSAVQDDPTEICAQLDGTTVPLGSTFNGLLPPAHPNCRCDVALVLPSLVPVQSVRPSLSLVR
jgi:SPP1 gp7 family putative phage head morphogenesis protein